MALAVQKHVLSQSLQLTNWDGYLTRILHFEGTYNVNAVQLLVCISQERTKGLVCSSQAPKSMSMTVHLCVCHTQTKQHIMCTFAGFYVCQRKMLKIFNYIPNDFLKGFFSLL